MSAYELLGNSGAPGNERLNCGPYPAYPSLAMWDWIGWEKRIDYIFSVSVCCNHFAQWAALEWLKVFLT
jgi:hypothetical protein